MNIAIHAHVFYPELWEELADCLRNFQGYPYDLFVTTPHSDETLKRRILSDFPHADYRVLENRGYDVGPFMEVLNSLDLDKYDFIVKLHTKRNWTGWINFMHVRESQWRDMLLSFCRTKQDVETALQIFQCNPKSGMLANASLIVTRGDYPESEIVKQRAEQLLREARLKTKQRIFVAGTMFMARTQLLKPLQRLHVLNDFDPVKKHEVGTLAHTYERLLGYAISAQGMQIVPMGRPKNNLSFFWPIIASTYRILAFLYSRLRP